MPVYEYLCDRCGEFEADQRISDDPLKKCPKCRSSKVRRLISSTSFQLRGSGWYITDYGKGGSGASAAPKPEAKAESTETKPAAKGKAKADTKAA